MSTSDLSVPKPLLLTVRIRVFFAECSELTLGTIVENPVSVSVNTNYPFSDTLTTTITAAKAFTYYVRIPSWVVGGTIAVNGAKAVAVAPKNGLQAVSAKAGTTTFVLNLPAPITIGTFRFLSVSPKGAGSDERTRIPENRLHGSVAIHRGPLHYAYQISHNDTVLPSNTVRMSYTICMKAKLLTSCNLHFRPFSPKHNLSLSTSSLQLHPPGPSLLTLRSSLSILRH